LSELHRNAPQHAKLMDGGFDASGQLLFAELPADELLARLRQLLRDGIHGMSFSAYLEGQGPDQKTVLSEQQIRDRLKVIAPYTRWVRTFSCTDGNEHAPRVAHELGLKTMVGAWIGDDREKNAEEIAALIEVGRAGHADLIAVGNEVLLRGELPEGELLELIHQVKAALPGLPVAYVDAYFLFAQHPGLVDACDYLPINCYPFWEKCPLERSIVYVQEMVRRVRSVSHGKPIVIAETGWPTAGTPEGSAVPSLENAALYALNLIPWAAHEGLPLFWFSAFDEAWKVGKEGDCGAYWGFWDATGTLKFSVSPPPAVQVG
jgi:glucan 1,3-beta-glucosidase